MGKQEAVEDAAEKEGCLQAYEEYLENPLAVVQGKMLARVPGEAFSEEDPWHVLLWHFFFDEATDTEIEEFVAALKRCAHSRCGGYGVESTSHRRRAPMW